MQYNSSTHYPTEPQHTAFPFVIEAGSAAFETGLTKREWMATQLLAASVAKDGGADLSERCKAMIELTDELIRQLNQTNP